MFDHGVGIKNPLFFIGVIENNKDGRLEGRVQVRAFGVHGTVDEVPTDMLPWAIVAQGGYDPNVVPKINSWVYGMFLDGRDAQNPMVLGLIPTQYADQLDPARTGWGVIPGQGGDVDAHGSAPEDISQPQNDRLARGEHVQETHVFQDEMGRTLNVPIAGSEETWDQPGSAYNAEYPKNRVISTKNHSIELDDTEGAERIMIHHKSGSFIQIDARGTTTEKTASDKYDVMDRKQHVVVGGMSSVTILGNSYVYVEGNKVEEIQGDLQTLVHGNHMLSVGGQSTINAGDQVQVRGADVNIQANVGTMSINAAKELNMSSGGLPGYGQMSIKSEKIIIDATDKLHLRGNTQVNIQSVAEMNISAISINQLAARWAAHSSAYTRISSAITDVAGTISVAIGGGVTTNINSGVVNVSNMVKLAPPIPARTPVLGSIEVLAKAAMVGGTEFPFVPGSPLPELAPGATECVAPEPINKLTSIVPIYIPGSRGSSGYSARDHGGGGSNNDTDAGGNISAVTQNALTPLLDFIGNKESEGYDDISDLVSDSRYPAKPLTQMTIQEVLDWQESIDRFQLSEASGRYQFMEDTLRGYDNDISTGPGSPLYTAAGLSSGDLFNPINQDKMAITLMKYARLNKFLDGTITRDEFANNLAGIWASLPLVTGPNAGESQYEDDIAGNKARTSIGEFRAVLDTVITNIENPDAFDPRGES